MIKNQVLKFIAEKQNWVDPYQTLAILSYRNQ